MSTSAVLDKHKDLLCVVLHWHCICHTDGCGLRSYFSSPGGKYFGMNFGSCKYSNFHGNRTRAKRFGNLISHHGGFISFENVCKKLMGIGNHSNCFNWVIFMKNWLFITPFTTWLLRVKQITRVHGKVREFGNLWLLWPCISDRWILLGSSWQYNNK